ncbi:hypothetical protein OAQ94_06325 [Gammaproteobacteria bacterium]|nr:hypothetical protein [Gammaproteobacteria bacterium]MDC0919534.1 hypothetical protein [Gammaproteobacteria bacterium]
MAFNISQALLKSKRLPSMRLRPFYTLAFKIKRFFLEVFRSFKKKLIVRKLKLFKTPPSPPDIILGKNFELEGLGKISQQYKSNKYAFIENFFSKETHDKLCDSFPHEVFFSYPRHGSKFYKWSDETRFIKNDDATLFNPSNGKEFFSLYPMYRDLYSFLASIDMIKKVKTLTDSKDAVLYSIFLTRAEEGSFLSPHIDSVALNAQSKSKEMINIIYFLLSGGRSPDQAGGTGLYHDNEFKHPIFIPQTLRNSALVYDSINQINHGFDVMAPGAFRWAIAIQYKIC